MKPRFWNRLFSPAKTNALRGVVEKNRRPTGRKLALEALENRALLSATSPSVDAFEAFGEAEIEFAADRSVSSDFTVGMSPIYEGPDKALAGSTTLAADVLKESGQNPNALTKDFIFNLSSRASSQYTIYLDFTGNVYNDFKNYWECGGSAVTPVYDTDGSPSTFSNNELLQIYEIWLRVAEDYAPFDVNVTTVEANVDQFSGKEIKCCIGGSCYDWGNVSCGGVAYVGSFGWSSKTPCYVFPKELGLRPKSIAEAATHEVGHTVGLRHDGNASQDYHEGSDGWAPIMGTGYHQPLTQWSRGEYVDANNQEDDLNIITTTNGFWYRPDDVGNSISTAKTLSFSSNGKIAEGVIERNADVDYFKIVSDGTLNGTMTVGGIDEITNLDVLGTLYDGSGARRATFDPLDSTSIVVDLSTLTAGTWYLAIEGTGKVVDGKTIYTDYGSLGQYRIQTQADYNAYDLEVAKRCGVEPTDCEWNASGRLTKLVCNGKDLTGALDASGCVALEYLDCRSNALTSVDVSGCAALEFFSCSTNSLANLDVSDCSALKELYCWDNLLTSLDVSNCSEMTIFVCAGNSLTNLNVSGCVALEHLDCMYNALTSVDVSGCVALKSFQCGGNALTSVDVSVCTALENFYCWGNALTSLDVSGLSALTKLYCFENQLTVLDASDCSALEELCCYCDTLKEVALGSVRGAAIDFSDGSFGATAKWYRLSASTKTTIGSDLSYTPTTGEALPIYCDFYQTNATTSFQTIAIVAVLGPETKELTSITLSTKAPKVGTTITTTLNPSGATASYKWYRVSTSGTSTAIANATKSSYKTTTSDVGYYLKVVATGTGSYSGSVSSQTTSVVPAVVDGPTQKIYGERSSYEVVPGKEVAIGLIHESVDVEQTTSLGLLIHFDSRVLTYKSTSDCASGYVVNSLKVYDETTSTDDGLASTDKYVFVAWSDYNGWPASNPQKVLTVVFELNADAPVDSTTTIRFTGDENCLSPDCAFSGTDVSVEAVSPASFDIDGNGRVTMADANFLLRYLAYVRGEELTSGLISSKSTRNAAEIETFLSDSIEFLSLDIDGNGRVTMADANFLLRYLAYVRGEELTSGLISSKSTRNATEIEEYLQSLIDSASVATSASVLDALDFDGGKIELAPDDQPISSAAPSATVATSGATFVGVTHYVDGELSGGNVCKPGDTTTLDVYYSADGFPTSFGLNVEYDVDLLEFDAAASSCYATGLIARSFPGSRTAAGLIVAAWNDQAGWSYPDGDAPIATLVFTVKDVADGSSGRFALAANADSLGDDDSFVSEPVNFTVSKNGGDSGLRAQIDAAESVRRDCAVFVDASASEGDATEYWWDWSGTGEGEFVCGGESFWLFARELATNEDGEASVRLKVAKTVDGRRIESAPTEFLLTVEESEPQIDVRRADFAAGDGRVVRLETLVAFAPRATAGYRYSFDWGDGSASSPEFEIGNGAAVASHYYAKNDVEKSCDIKLTLVDEQNDVVAVYELGAAPAFVRNVASAPARAEALSAAIAETEFDDFDALLDWEPPTVGARGGADRFAFDAEKDDDFWAFLTETSNDGE